MATLTIVTWPYQWIYWPVYRALENLQERRHGDPITVIWKTDLNNDDEILRCAAELAGGGDPRDSVVAICAPPARHNQPKPAEMIEVLWRLPHWLMTRAPGEETSPGSLREGTVLAYPRGSTSGDYARQQYGRAVVEAEALDIDRYVDDTLEHRFAFTFSPLFELPSTEIRLTEELNGSMYQVTAIQLFRGADAPTAVRTAQSIAAATLFEAWREEVKRILLQLTLTQGQIERLKDLIAKGGDLSIGNTSELSAPPFLRKYDASLRPYAIARLMREYVRRNCYFPYQFIDSTVGHHVEAMAEENLKRILGEARVSVKKAMRSDLRRFMGFSTTWGDLAFRERQEANSVIDRGGQKSPGPLWHHLKDRDDLLSVNQLSEYWVELTRGGVTLDLFCGDRDDVKCEKASCVVNGVSPCFICEFCGFARVLGWRGAEALQAGLVAKGYSGETVPVRIAGGADRGTVVTYREIEGMVAVFNDEMRKRRVSSDGVSQETTSTPLCQLAIAVGDKGSELVEDVLVAVLWNGATTRGSGSGNTARGLRRWVRDQRKRGCAVLAWTFVAKADGTEGEFSDLEASGPEPDAECADCCVARDTMWNVMLSGADVTAFRFAYVALFGCGHGGESS